MTNSLDKKLKALDDAKLKLLHSALEDKRVEIDQLIQEATEELKAPICEGGEEGENK